MRDTYLVFIIQAHEGETPELRLMDVTTLEIIEETPTKALARAKSLIKKKFYRISTVIEKHYERT